MCNVNCRAYDITVTLNDFASRSVSVHTWTQTKRVRYICYFYQFFFYEYTDRILVFSLGVCCSENIHMVVIIIDTSCLLIIPSNIPSSRLTFPRCLIWVTTRRPQIQKGIGVGLSCFLCCYHDKKKLLNDTHMTSHVNSVHCSFIAWRWTI